MGQRSKRNVKKAPEKKFSIYDPTLPKVTKRIAAFIVDIILEIITATGVGLLVSLIYGYDNYYNKMVDRMLYFGVYVKGDDGALNYCDSTLDSCKAAMEACKNDAAYFDASWGVFIGIILIISIGIAVSLLIYEFILPLILKHGRTIGMRFFGIGYVTEDGIEPPVRNIFTRFLFGKLIMEGLIPFVSLALVIMGTLGATYGLLGIIFFAIGLLLNIYLLLGTPYKRGIHDVIARMRPVDNSCQIYCKTTEELAEAKAEEARGR